MKNTFTFLIKRWLLTSATGFKNKYLTNLNFDLFCLNAQMQENRELTLLNAEVDLLKEKETSENENIKSNNTTFKNNDPYAYLDRNAFTSEKFKIEIRNLPKYYGIKVGCLFKFLP